MPYNYGDKMTALLTPTSKDIEEAIEKHEKMWGYTDRILYKRCIDDANARNLRLCKITEEHIEGIVKTFLINWGMLGRVLNSKGRKDKWKEDILKKIKEYCKDLENLRELKLESTDIGKCRNEIIKCYEDFKKIIGPVGASKLLHLFAPEFFPMWDNAIINQVKKECKSSTKINTSAEGFYNYILKVQKLLQKEWETWNKLSEQYDKPKLRITDNFMWIVANGV
jgi:hypothetical protein